MCTYTFSIYVHIHVYTYIKCFHFTQIKTILELNDEQQIIIQRLTVDQCLHAGGCDLWSTFWYVQVQAGFTPEGNAVVFPAGGEVQSKGLTLRFLQTSAATGLQGRQFSLLLVKDHLEFLNRGGLLDCTLHSVPLALPHGARVTNKTDGHLTGRLCGQTGGFSLIWCVEVKGHETATGQRSFSYGRR